MSLLQREPEYRPTSAELWNVTLPKVCIVWRPLSSETSPYPRYVPSDVRWALERHLIEGIYLNTSAEFWNVTLPKICTLLRPPSSGTSLYPRNVPYYVRRALKRHLTPGMFRLTSAVLWNVIFCEGLLPLMYVREELWTPSYKESYSPVAAHQTL